LRIMLAPHWESGEIAPFFQFFYRR
jgi:hypothetical protein